MKICIICGYSVENTEKQCPNCGSYSFKTEEQLKNTNNRLRKFT